MMGFGLLMMLLVLGLPVVSIAAILIGVLALLGRRSRPIFSPPTSTGLAKQDARYCSACGQDLQAGRTHCPKCEAPRE